MSVNELRAEAIDGEVRMVGKRNNPAMLTHWSFGQLARKIGAPADYLRDLPATLACQNLNHGLAKLSADDEAKAKLLFHSNGSLMLRAITGQDYARIWNYEIAAKLLELESQGWTPAKPDLRFDGGDASKCQVCDGTGGVKVDVEMTDGDCQTCKGTGQALPALYASDHDMFAFVKNNSATIREQGNPDGLQRGVIVSNSEVGAASLRLTRFLYREMCGNHIIWGASKVVEIAIRHVGDARNRWGVYEAEVKRYAEESASEDEAKIASARRVVIGATKEDVLDKLFSIRGIGLSRKALDASYDAVVTAEDGQPNTVWGIVQGITRYSQTLKHADARTEMDRAAGRIMEVDF